MDNIELYVHCIFNQLDLLKQWVQEQQDACERAAERAAQQAAQQAAASGEFTGFIRILMVVTWRALVALLCIMLPMCSVVLAEAFWLSCAHLSETTLLLFLLFDAGNSRSVSKTPEPQLPTFVANVSLLVNAVPIQTMAEAALRYE